MTRLTEKDIKGLTYELKLYDADLYRKTGMTLLQIACTAAGLSIDYFLQQSASKKVAVVPITVGQGIIGSFASSIQGVTNYLGFETFVTEETDVTGIAKGVINGADILFMADDNKFIAVNLEKKLIIDNGKATGRGFVAAMQGLANGLKNKEVLVIGAGQVGSEAISYLLSIGAKVAFLDSDPMKTKALIEQYPDKLSSLKIESNLNQALLNYKYIVDACPLAAFMTQDNLHPEAKVAAPGVPLGLTADLYSTYQHNVIHDPLQIGVATMLAMAVCQ
ncbi:MAG: 3-methylornithyl-N6-L-lysine dehydrogenase PylD [Bacillota bacterium]|nr:3-methylornithyl-N6-L-lysine dehydrogenase PylD [Bacillota bacterium]